MPSSTLLACWLPAAWMPASAGPARLAPLDLALVALYLIGITVFGLRFSRRPAQPGSNSLKTYFLAGNTIPWWAIALSIVSAETSTLTIISIPGVAYAGNLGFLQVVLGYMLGRVVVAMLFLPRYFAGQMLTAYQLIGTRFGPTLHKLTAGLFLLTRAAAEGVRVFAISIVIGIAIGTGDVLSIAIISALTLAYTFEGGMAAVIWTDVVQMALYLAGTLVALVTLGHAVPGGWAHIHAVAAPLGKFAWLDFTFSLTKSYTFWAGLLGGTFLTMASHGTDQLMVQRLLAARNLRGARIALLSSGVVIFIQFALFLVIGVGLFVFYGGGSHAFASADRIFPTFIVRQMPHGVAGLLIAAILAAAMSNLSAALNSLASTTVVDFYLPLKRSLRAPLLRSSTAQEWETETANPGSAQANAESRERTLISRAATVFWALVLFAIAVYSIAAGGKGHVVETGLSIASVAYGCLLGVFLLGTLTRYASQTGAILGMITGLAVNLFLWLTPADSGFTYTTPTVTRYFEIPHIAFTWYVLIGALVTFFVGSLASLIFRRKHAITTTTAVLLAFALLTPAQSLCAPSMPASSAWVGPPQTSDPADVHQLLPSTSTGQPTYDFTPVSTILTTAIAQNKLPGAVVLIGHNGHVVFEHAYGKRALEPTVEPMTDDTIFDMASLTKVLVTTTAVLQLYEQKKLDLDLPVAHYLPDFANNGKDKITIRELLTHYSGLPEDVDLKDSWGLAKPDKAEGIRRAMHAVPYGPPGITFKYSDINFITLGYLVEKLTGKDLDVYSRSEIFDPLGMSSYFTSYLPIAKACGPKVITGSAISLKTEPEKSDSPFYGDFSCAGWIPANYIDHTAPTTYDDQGTALTNPDFNHMLRGTVNDPTTRRMGGVAGHAGVFSTADDTARFAQALLDKLLHNTGPFPLTQATLRMATMPNQPATAAANATIFTQSGETTKGVATRGLGWDLNSPFSRPRGTIFPITSAGHPGSFGHTGFTGTSLWIDPTTDTYVILLANAIHPRGRPAISALRGEVATAAAHALHICPPSTICDATVSAGDASVPVPAAPEIKNSLPATSPTHRDETAMHGAQSGDALSHLSETDHFDLNSPILTGIDVLESTSFAALQTLAATHAGHLRLGLLTNQTGLDAAGHRTIDLLAHAGHGITLTTLFTPEHGLLGRQDTEHLTPETDPATHLPILSLYGPKPADKRPRQADLRALDAVVIDLQDAGVRDYTYETLTGYFLEACAQAHIPLIVLDRPNPLGGLAVQGPMIDAGRESYTAYSAGIPLRHGLTLGELARFFNTYAPTPALAAQPDPEAIHIGPDTSGQTGRDDRPSAAINPAPNADLIVIPMQGWRRDEYFDQTGQPFIAPSPNLHSVTAEITYPAVTLLETTNVSVGRGSPTPFELLAAPWLNAHSLKTFLDTRQIPGVRFTAGTTTIAEDQNRYPSHGQTVPALRLEVTDRTVFDSPECGLELLAALHHLYPKEFELDRARTILANDAVLKSLRDGDDPRQIASRYADGLATFRRQREPILLYGRRATAP